MPEQKLKVLVLEVTVAADEYDEAEKCLEMALYADDFPDVIFGFKEREPTAYEQEVYESSHSDDGV